MKSLTKLVGSNTKFYGFFEMRRDITGAWSVFRFFNSSQMPRTTDAKINQKYKNSLFSVFLDFFHPFERFLDACRLFKFEKKRFSGSRVLKFGKIHDRFSFLDWGIILGGLVFSHLEGSLGGE